MLVDMAGSENIDQAGQVGFEAKMQDSFEDDRSKILMILCASPDPKEIHKTICTLEYGAKAKCIVRGPHTPIKDKNEEGIILGSRLAAMDQFINKLQMENKLREKERNEAHKLLLKKEEEVAALRALVEGKGSGGTTEEEINSKVNERTQMLRLELEKKLDECRRMAEEFVEMERRRMEERILQQQEEVEMLRRRLQEIEFELCRSRDGNGEENDAKELVEGISFAKRLIGMYGDEVPGMVKSMDLDMGDPEPFIRDVKQSESSSIQGFLNHNSQAANHDVFAPQFGAGLSTVYEEEETEEDEEVEKVIIEEKRVCSSGTDHISFPLKSELTPKQPDCDSTSSRKLRIQNIFTLCGNQRELSQHTRTTTPDNEMPENIDPHWCPNTMIASDVSVVKSSNKENSPAGMMAAAAYLKENQNPSNDCNDAAQIEVYVKWEASKENPGSLLQH